MSAEAIYNKIGKTYDQTRKADPEITKKLIKHLCPKDEGNFLDVGCGSGNYTQALYEHGLQIRGIDISEEMLAKAKHKNPQIQWTLGDAMNLPFVNNQFDGATCTLATHHIKNIEQSFKEIFRVLNKGHFVIFTSFPKQMEDWWLNHYFPNMMHMAANMMHCYERISTALKAASFEDVRTETFFVSTDLQDWFLQAGKYRPHLYLDPVARSGMSTFALQENQEEIINGCEKLKNDIASGKIEEIIKCHESDLGDYVFVVCTKK